MSDIRNEAPFDSDDDLNWDWRRYIENKEALAQAKDCEMAKRFWDERPCPINVYTKRLLISGALDPKMLEDLKHLS
jgi:hypothetical protein